MHGRKLPPHAHRHALGAVLTVGLAGATWAAVLGSGLHRPGVRAAVLLGGLLVTSVLLLRDVRDGTLTAYAAAFFLSFALFAALGSVG